MALLLPLLCCRLSTLYPLALCAFMLSRKTASLSGPGPSLSDSEAYAFLQVFFSPQLALASLITAVLVMRNSRGRLWLPFVCLVGLTPPSTDLSAFAGPSSGLLNGLVLIHPPLLFFGYACLAAQILDLPSLRSRLLFSKRPHHLAAQSLVLFILALMLGAIWAQHELNWGGWWGWDLVELGSLFFLLISWSLTHQPAWSYGPSKLARHSLAFFISFYLGLRFGLFDSVHSFVGPTARLPTHVPLLYALPLLWLLRPRYHASKHLLGQGLGLALALIWLRAGLDPLSSSPLSFLCPSLGQSALLLLGIGASLLRHRARVWFLFGWTPFFMIPFGSQWFSIFNPRAVHMSVVLATLGLPLIKLAPLQLTSLYYPLVDSVILGPSSLMLAAAPALESFASITLASPLGSRADYLVQPGLHPALGSSLGANAAWSHGALVKNFITLLTLPALGSLCIVPSFYLVFALGLVKKHRIKQI